MLHPRKPILDAISESRDMFFAFMRARLAQHEEHARVTSSAMAYNAAMKMARTMRAAIAHIESGDVDAVCADLSAWVMVTECAESAMRATRLEESA